MCVCVCFFLILRILHRVLLSFPFSATNFLDGWKSVEESCKQIAVVKVKIEKWIVLKSAEPKPNFLAWQRKSRGGDVNEFYERIIFSLHSLDGQTPLTLVSCK